MDSRDGGPIHVGPETETGRGWSYEVSLAWPDGHASSHSVTLSWADHDLIAGGMHPPSRTVEAAMCVLLAVGGDVIKIADLPERIDVSTLRRQITDFDGLVQARL